jgi:hypothetical protein
MDIPKPALYRVGDCRIMCFLYAFSLFHHFYHFLFAYGNTGGGYTFFIMETFGDGTLIRAALYQVCAGFVCVRCASVTGPRVSLTS